MELQGCSIGGEFGLVADSVSSDCETGGVSLVNIVRIISKRGSGV